MASRVAGVEPERSPLAPAAGQSEPFDLRHEAELLAADLLGRADVMTEHLMSAGTLLARVAVEPARQLLRDLDEVASRHPSEPGNLDRLRAAVAEQIDARTATGH